MSRPAGAADALSSPTRSSQPGGERRLSTPERILHAAAARIVAGGTANLSMQDVADAAGVSKGLIHYHFHDKETLLTRLIEWMTRESIERESATLARSVPKTAVDDLWTWVAGEIERGHLRVLNELAQERGPLISDAIRHSARAPRGCGVDGGPAVRTPRASTTCAGAAARGRDRRLHRWPGDSCVARARGESPRRVRRVVAVASESCRVEGLAERVERRELRWLPTLVGSVVCTYWPLSFAA